MFVTRSIEADHKDLIHDVAYDFYGKRLATCSSDQSVKVWDMTVDGTWKCTASWKTHSGSVWKVTWAHPEFGQVLATCSFDRTAAVWEELIVEGAGGERNQSHWVKRATLVDSRTSVTDIKFAPKHLGLQLATCSSDGMLRIYEAPDIMNICQWQLQHDIPCRMSCSCVTWSPSRMHPTMIAVGSDDNIGTCGKVIIFEYNDNLRKWNQIDIVSFISEPVNDIAFAPNLGWSYNYIAVATNRVKIISIRSNQDGLTGNVNSFHQLNQSAPSQITSSGGSQKYNIRQVMQSSDHSAPVWRVSWNVTGTILASSVDDGTVRLWKANYLDNWKCIAVINGENFSANNINTNGTEITPNINIDSKNRARFYKMGAIDNPNNVPWH